MMRTFSPQQKGAAATAQAKATLGDLPEWNLADLYASMDAPELKADIDRAGRESEAFESRWKGTLAAEAGKGATSQLGAALRDFETLGLENVSRTVQIIHSSHFPQTADTPS